MNRIKSFLDKSWKYIKDYSGVIIAVLVVLVFVFGGIYFAKRTSNSSTKSGSESSELVEYSNELLGFSIKVPKDATVNKNWNTLTITPAEDTSRSWKIDEVDSIYGEAGLNALIKTELGKSCSYEDMSPSRQEGTMDVTFNDGGVGSDCFINYVVAIKYSPTLHKAAIWSRGQDALFGDRDQEMADSFKFL